jgi:hypothetical protein
MIDLQKIAQDSFIDELNKLSNFRLDSFPEDALKQVLNKNTVTNVISGAGAGLTGIGMFLQHRKNKQILKNLNEAKNK